jgi:hypothetical protein
MFAVRAFEMICLHRKLLRVLYSVQAQNSPVAMWVGVVLIKYIRHLSLLVMLPNLFTALIADVNIRSTVIDGKKYLSTRDIIMHVCETDEVGASAIWDEHYAFYHETLAPCVRRFYFLPEAASSVHAVIFENEVSEFIMQLPGILLNLRAQLLPF